MSMAHHFRSSTGYSSWSCTALATSLRFLPSKFSRDSLLTSGFHRRVNKPQCYLRIFGTHKISQAKMQQCLCSISSTMDPVPSSEEHQKLIKTVKDRLEAEHGYLPIGRNGRDDEQLILWFLKDRKFDIDKTVFKLVKAISWRQEFGVDTLTEKSVENIASTGKAYLHAFPDVTGCPVVIVVAAKHFHKVHDLLESEKLCVYLLEKALTKLPPGQDKILGIFDLRGFTFENSDISFMKFMIDVFYYYYPKRLGQVLFVDAPLIFQPAWNIMKPLLKSYANLVRFCSADVVRDEYFTPETVPYDFRF